MLFQATQLLLLIISLCKVNGISFRHSAPSPSSHISSPTSGYVTTEADALFAPIPTPREILPTVDHYGLLSNSIDPLEAYISGKDGRLLKQYQVFESHGEPDIYNNDLEQPPQTSLSSFFYPTAHNPLLYSDPTFPFLAKGVPYEDSFTTNLPLVKSQLSKNHGPIALGSGALGYIRLPSGAVYLGSGSLAYISHKDHHDSLSTIHERRRISSNPGPLSFGHHLH